MSQAYRMHLVKDIDQIEKDFGNFTPSPFPKSLFQSDMPDEALYFMAKTWRDSTEKNYQSKNVAAPEKKDKRIWLKPMTVGNTVYIIDRDANVVRSVIHKNGHGVSFHGYESDISRFGGRGELHQIGVDMEDGKLFSGYGK